MAPQLTPTKKARVWQAHCYGKSNAEIAREFDRDRSTIGRLITQMSNNPDPYHRAPGRGRPRKLSERDLRVMRRNVRSGKLQDAADVQNTLFPDISGPTIRRALHSVGLKSYVRQKKPFLPKSALKKRLKLAHELSRWPSRRLRFIWFSDESKFNRIGSDGRHYYWGEPGESLFPQNVVQVASHGGGSVMVWGVISWNGVGRLYRIHGNVNAAAYLQILQEGLLPSLDDAGVQTWEVVYQQDNAPAHRGAQVKQWLGGKHMEILWWPPYSPDLNIIENLWSIIKRRVRKRTPFPSNVDQLWSYVEEEWYQVTVEEIQALYESIPRRVNAVIQARGGWTRY